jgi:redox-sensitive bicupin YhaK (pirin superfamily)
MKNRTIDQIVSPVATSDGAGVKIKRAIGTMTLDHLDPFLLLDVFASEDGADYIAGFPPHPHRGFETVTYMLNGKMRHQDNAGNEGLLKDGAVQWMTAGRGIIHSEMPEQSDGLMRGFQIWVNLPAKDKMIAPRYQDLQPEEFELHDLEGVGKLKVITGSAFGITGPVNEIVTQPLLLDLDMQPNAQVIIPVEQGKTAFLYVFDGEIHVDCETIPTDRLVIFDDGDQVEIKTGGKSGRFILMAANPIKEPIARHGPFVMNTQEEIYQAFEDFQAGRF